MEESNFVIGFEHDRQQRYKDESVQFFYRKITLFFSPKEDNLWVQALLEMLILFAFWICLKIFEKIHFEI